MNIPEGWKLVPVDPTEEMIEASCKLKLTRIRGGLAGKGIAIGVKEDWAAMLAVAPEWKPMITAAATSPPPAGEAKAVACWRYNRRLPDGTWTAKPYLWSDGDAPTEETKWASDHPELCRIERAYLHPPAASGVAEGEQADVKLLRERLGQAELRIETDGRLLAAELEERTRMQSEINRLSETSSDVADKLSARAWMLSAFNSPVDAALLEAWSNELRAALSRLAEGSRNPQADPAPVDKPK